MSNRNKRATKQLGINISTAQAKLRKQILWELLKETNRNKCFVCGKEMTQEDFSIEHIVPWLDKLNAKELFFDWSNISFSHLSCNVQRQKRKQQRKIHGTYNMYTYYKCRCNLCKKANAEQKKKNYSKEKRQKKYVETGK